MTSRSDSDVMNISMAFFPSYDKDAVIKDTLHNKHAYLLTLHKFQVKEYVSPAELNYILQQLRWKNPTMALRTWSYELSPMYNQLHMHLLVTTSKPVNFKENSKMTNFRIFWSPLKRITRPEISRCYDYIHKHASNKAKQEIILFKNIDTSPI